jgi:A/G-specific adenine glycosylase
VGSYTARALPTLAFERASAAPRDVNLSRVTARAALGVEPHQAPAARLDEALAAARPAEMSPRDHALALFDLGATVCHARRPLCERCPLPACASRHRLATAPPPPPPRRQGPYQGSLRQLRGTVLRAMLDGDPPRTSAALRARVESVLGTVDRNRLDDAVSGLHADGLLPQGCPTMRRSWPPSPPT